MSRKHYVAVAVAFRAEVVAADEANDASAVNALGNVARELCRVFKSDNSAFDAQRFLTACGF